MGKTQIPQPGTPTTTQPASTQPYNTTTSSGSQPPQWGSGATSQTYLGVPNDYTTAQTPTGMWGVPATFTSEYGIKPTYKQGDQYRELPTDATQLALLQHALIDAGLISDTQSKSIAFGSPDPLTVQAFEKLLVSANISGGSWQSAMAQRLAAVAANPPADVKKVPPLIVTLTNPEDIKDTLQKTTQTLLGGSLPEDQANAFVAQFQAQEQAAKAQEYALQYDPAAGTYGPGGTVTAPPSLDNAAKDYAKATAPNQYQATQFGSMVTAALDSLRSTGYLPSNVGPVA